MKIIIIIALSLISNLATSQNLKLHEYKVNEDFSYILGNIWWDNLYSKELSGSLIVVLEQSDPHNTPKGLFEGYGGSISNLIISVKNTGEFAYSKLYFIRGLISPSVLKVEETSDLKKIKIKIRHKNRHFKKQTQTFLIPSIH